MSSDIGGNVLGPFPFLPISFLQYDIFLLLLFNFYNKDTSKNPLP